MVRARRSNDGTVWSTRQLCRRSIAPGKAKSSSASLGTIPTPGVLGSTRGTVRPGPPLSAKRGMWWMGRKGKASGLRYHRWRSWCCDHRESLSHTWSVHKRTRFIVCVGHGLGRKQYGWKVSGPAPARSRFLANWPRLMTSQARAGSEQQCGHAVAVAAASFGASRSDD